MSFFGCMLSRSGPRSLALPVFGEQPGGVGWNQPANRLPRAGDASPPQPTEAVGHGHPWARGIPLLLFRVVLLCVLCGLCGKFSSGGSPSCFMLARNLHRSTHGIYLRCHDSATLILNVGNFLFLEGSGKSKIRFVALANAKIYLISYTKDF